MRPISNITKKHPGRYVPKVHQTKADENVKFINIKKGTSHTEYLTHKDIRQLQKKFKFTPNLKEPVKLGNTGIQIVYQNGRFIMKKA